MPRSWSKYKAVPVEIDGHRFASRAEGAFYQHLKTLEAAGVVKAFRLQPRFELDAGIKYVGDFEVWLELVPFGHIIDVKGVETAAFKMKKKLFKAKYGQEIQVVKAQYRSGKITFNWPPAGLVNTERESS